MDITAERLYQAAKKLKNIEGQSMLARFLDKTPQTVKNWETRGISKNGMIKAEERIGCSVTWLRTGKGSMVSISSDASKKAIDRIIEIAQEEIVLSGKNLDDATRMKIYKSAIMYQIEFDIGDDELRNHLSTLIK